MKVICRSTEVTREQREEMGQPDDTSRYYLDVGKTYTVMGFGCGAGVDGGAVLFLPGEHYLLPVPLCLFDVVDERPSRYWVARKNSEHTLSLWPVELHIDYFQDRLSDFEPELIPIYQELCARMESEFD